MKKENIQTTTNRTMYVMHVKKERKKNGSGYNYKLKDWKVYPKLSLYNALFYASTIHRVESFAGIRNNDNKKIHPYKAQTVIGYSEYPYNELTLICIVKGSEFNIITKKKLIDEYYFNFDTVCLEMNLGNIKRIMNILEDIIKEEGFEKKLPDYGTPWGAKANMPKGYHLIHSGKTRIGDFVLEYDSGGGKGWWDEADGGREIKNDMLRCFIRPNKKN